MKNTLIGGFFFIGGILLICADVIGNRLRGLEDVGTVIGLFGMGVLLYEFFKDKIKNLLDK